MYKISKSDKSFSTFSFSLYYTLLAAYRGAFRTWLNIYNGAFLTKVPNGVKLLTIVTRKAPSQMFESVENRFLAKFLHFKHTFVPNLQIKPKKKLSQKICVTSTVYAEAAVRGVL